MKALLVDDERLALLRLKSMLEQEEGVRIAGVFSDGSQALEGIRKTAPDIVFLDIGMPEIDGLELASRIRAADASIDIVFTSGSVRHAVEAYEYYPLDYMRKPIDRQRLSRTLDRARHRLTAEIREEAGAAGQPGLRCLGPLQVDRPGLGPGYPKWRTTKAQELFAYLLHNRGRMVGRDTLFELLWQGFEPERAASQLYNTIYTVRAVLKDEGLDLTLSKGGPAAGYRLETGSVKVDVEDWEEGLAALPPIGPETVRLHEASLRGYTGDYLAELDYAWAHSERERLRRLWMAHARQLSQFYRAQRMRSEEEAVAQRLHHFK